MYVYLPHGYERDRRLRYPVIEAAHGISRIPADLDPAAAHQGLP
jgi:hypothetical protein